MKKGFTLLELLCVLALICVLLLIASPSLMGYIMKDRLKLATERLVNDLRYAKLHAMSGRVPAVNTVFERKSGESDFTSYWIYSGDLLSNMTLKRVSLPDGVVIFKGTDGSTFNTDNKITFNSQGDISPFACTIALKDLSTGEKRHITLTIGFTRIMEVSR